MIIKLCCQLCNCVCVYLNSDEKIIGPVWCIDCQEKVLDLGARPLPCKIGKKNDDSE